MMYVRKLRLIWTNETSNPINNDKVNTSFFAINKSTSEATMSIYAPDNRIYTV